MRSGNTLRSALSASVLALAVAGLGWMDWRLLNWPVEAPPSLPAPVAMADEVSPSAPAGQMTEAPQFASFAVIGDRPLFVAGRRYKPAVTDAPSQVAAGTPEFRLSGIMLRDGKARALIAAADAPSEWVSEGQSISGWTVRRIHPSAAELASETQAITIELYKPATSAP